MNSAHHNRRAAEHRVTPGTTSLSYRQAVVRHAGTVEERRPQITSSRRVKTRVRASRSGGGTEIADDGPVNSGVPASHNFGRSGRHLGSSSAMPRAAVALSALGHLGNSLSTGASSRRKLLEGISLGSPVRTPTGPRGASFTHHTIRARKIGSNTVAAAVMVLPPRRPQRSRRQPRGHRRRHPCPRRRRMTGKLRRISAAHTASSISSR